MYLVQCTWHTMNWNGTKKRQFWKAEWTIKNPEFKKKEWELQKILSFFTLLATTPKQCYSLHYFFFLGPLSTIVARNLCWSHKIGRKLLANGFCHKLNCTVLKGDHSWNSNELLLVIIDQIVLNWANEPGFFYGFLIFACLKIAAWEENKSQFTKTL